MSTLRQKKPKPKKGKTPKKLKGKTTNTTTPPPLCPASPRPCHFLQRDFYYTLRFSLCFSSRLSLSLSLVHLFRLLCISIHIYMHLSPNLPPSCTFVWDLCGFSQFSPCSSCCFHIFPLLSFFYVSRSCFFSRFLWDWDWLWIWVRSRIGFDSPRFALVMWFQLIHGRG